MSKADRLKAILTITAGFLVLHLLFKKDVFLYIATGIALVALIFPFVAKGIVWLWYKMAEILGWINSRILLTLVFFVFLVPISFLYRLTTRNPLQLKKKNNKSLYNTRDHLYKKEDFKFVW
jgi:hypothetical protein